MSVCINVVAKGLFRHSEVASDSRCCAHAVLSWIRGDRRSSFRLQPPKKRVNLTIAGVNMYTFIAYHRLQKSCSHGKSPIFAFQTSPRQHVENTPPMMLSRRFATILEEMGANLDTHCRRTLLFVLYMLRRSYRRSVAETARWVS